MNLIVKQESLGSQGEISEELVNTAAECVGDDADFIIHTVPLKFEVKMLFSLYCLCSTLLNFFSCYAMFITKNVDNLNLLTKVNLILVLMLMMLG